ncbi:PadR family transcriptional regulator [Oceanobacillus saliphilus]|uniref:PadR family transcriptional regulator n=1 Tax=Oceanobacillus saliphilus TaxID=2925834 RepID=UPI00201DB24C|nr:PadR family transcriptional regulator [Oceanobacillus saliphilus]
MKNSHTKYAIMGVITAGCRTGYSIKQMMDQSLTHFWKISYGQIYPTLKQLVEERLATVEDTFQDGKPDKKEYRLTEKGESELHAWLQEPIEALHQEKNELLLKLFFSGRQSKESTLNHLTAYKEKLEGRLNTYTSIENGILANGEGLEDAPYWLFTLDYGKRVTQAAMDWCDDTSSKLNQ